MKIHVPTFDIDFHLYVQCRSMPIISVKDDDNDV